MDIKGVFKKGFEEFKRRRALSKEKRNLKQRNKVYSEQLITLGKKAWEEHIDIDQYGNLEKLIASTQDQLDELNKEYGELDSRKQQSEETRKQKNDAFDQQRKEVEDKKKEVDKQLGDQKRILKDAQKEADNAKDRLNDIAKEEAELNRKVSDPRTPDPEKTAVRSKLDGFTREKEVLNQTIKDTANTVTAARGQIDPLEQQSANHQTEIDRIRSEQRTEIGELDKSISQLKTQLSDLDKKRSQTGQEQSGNFEQLGEQLAAAGGENPALASELSAVKATETEIAAIQSEIQTLESRGTDEAKGAFNQMLLLSGAALVLLIGLIFLLSWIFSPKEDPFAETVGKVKESITEAAKKPGTQPSIPTPSIPAPSTPVQTPEDAAKALKDVTGDVKKQADKMYGKEIVIADEAILKSTLPQNVPGWTAKEPAYRSQRFGQLEGAIATATYEGAQSRKVRVTVTDTGHASAILSPYMMIFNMNIKREDENIYEKVSAHDDIKIIEKYDKRSKRGQLTFIIKGRYLVGLKTDGEDSLKVLKQFIGLFNFSRLQ